MTSSKIVTFLGNVFDKSFYKKNVCPWNGEWGGSNDVYVAQWHFAKWLG